MPCSPTAPTSSRATGTPAPAAPSSETPSGTRDLTRSGRPSPTSIHYVEGTESQTAVQQVINDDERAPAVGDPRLRPAGDAAARALRRRRSRPVRSTRRRSSSTTSRPTCAKGVMRNAKRPQRPRPRHQPRGLRHRPRRRERRQRGLLAASVRRCPGTATPTRSAPGPPGDAGRGASRAAGVRADPAGQDPGRLPLDAHGRQGDGGPVERLGGRRLRRQPPADREGLLRRGVQARSHGPDRRLLGQLGARVAVGLDGASRRCSTAASTCPTSGTGRDFGGVRRRRRSTRRSPGSAALPDAAARADRVERPRRVTGRARGASSRWPSARRSTSPGSSVTGPVGQRGTGRVRRPRDRGCGIAT